jgi:Asp-tRNA(Asn)/Glu-tRNA(Gln) amidotransferase A subunit family amidase
VLPEHSASAQQRRSNWWVDFDLWFESIANVSQTNCLSDAFFDEAIESAKALDDHLTRTGKVVGPLHGLPISLKDNFNVKSKDSTVGFTSLVNDPAEHNSTLVDVLEKLGAVRYCKTNVPTAMMIVRHIFVRGSWILTWA